jgi:hypothetical protein
MLSPGVKYVILKVSRLSIYIDHIHATNGREVTAAWA